MYHVCSPRACGRAVPVRVTPAGRPRRDTLRSVYLEVYLD
jgi:hypothetical protein